MEVKVKDPSYEEDLWPGQLWRDTNDCLEILGCAEEYNAFETIHEESYYENFRILEELPWPIAQRVADLLGDEYGIAVRQLYLEADKEDLTNHLISLANVFLEASGYSVSEPTLDCDVVPFSAWFNGHFFGCTTLFIRTLEWQRAQLETPSSINETRRPYSAPAVMQGITKSLAASLVAYFFPTLSAALPRLNTALIPVVEEYCREHLLEPELYVAPLSNQKGILLKWFDFKVSPRQRIIYPHPEIVEQLDSSTGKWVYKKL